MKLQLKIFFALVAMALGTGAATHFIWSIWIAPRAMHQAPLRALAEAFDTHEREHWRSPRTRRRLRRLANRFDVEFTAYDSSGNRIAGRAGPVRVPSKTGGFTYRGRAAHLIHAEDGRALLVTARRSRGGPPFWVPLSILTLVFVGGSYLLSRSITARLENMRRSVESWGDGAVKTRVPVEGQDEVGALAQSFNRAADRIEQLVEGQRRMLASASHELRTPMTRIRMATELLRDEDSVPRRHEYADRIANDLGELDELVHDIMTSARLEASAQELVRVDLSEIARDEAARYAEAIVVDIASSVEVVGSARLLRQLIRNLVQNALRYGGESVPQLKLKRDPDDGSAILQVYDSGAGIDPSDVPHLFEPFFRASDHHEGQRGSVGLGLYLVRQIVEVHDGQVRYRREEEASIFEVRLPAINA